MNSPFTQTAAMAWTDLGDGIRRKVLAHTPDLMSVLVQFDKGAIGTPHAHDVHTQIAYVVAGAFEVTIDGRTAVLRSGDCFVAQPHAMHGVVALEAGSTLLDQFSPRRDDYL
ncbi:MAG: cupin domain-containing protein [Rubrivivax sp.]|nr:cupin domain-containing protein [Rubrivivax sp.]